MQNTRNALITFNDGSMCEPLLIEVSKLETGADIYKAVDECHEIKKVAIFSPGRIVNDTANFADQLAAHCITKYNAGEDLFYNDLVRWFYDKCTDDMYGALYDICGDITPAKYEINIPASSYQPITV